MRRKLKLPVLFIALLMLAAVFIPMDTKAEPVGSEIQIDIVGGYDGIAKLGAWTPVRIKINSLGRNVSGEIQVEANLDQARKIIVARPVDLMAGTGHEVSFEIPVVSAHKGVVIRLVEGKKTLVEENYQFKRLLPPEIKLIGVLSEDPEAFGWLNGNTVPIMQGGIAEEKYKLMIAAGQATAQAIYPTTSETSFQKGEAVVVPLDRDSFPDKQEVMDGFDMLIVSKFDTGLLREQQITTMEEWVNSGGLLILGTGLHWQKVYHGLPDSMKPFDIQETKDFESSALLKAFTGRDAANMTLKLAQGKLGFEYIPLPAQDPNLKPGIPARYFDRDVIAGDGQNPLVIKYRKSMGNIFVFTFDPSSEPFASWQSRNTFAEYVFRHADSYLQRYYEYGNGYYQKQYYNGMNFQYLANEVPSDKKPPFLLMFISLAVYVLLVGPVLYLVLKKMDRRDTAWVLIPLLSVVFLVGMYLFGFKSRYHSAVMNTVSLIQVTPGANEATVSSAIGVFNDKRGTLKLQYSQNNGLKTPFIQNNNYMNYRSYGNDVEGRVVGKYTIDEPIRFEQYDVMLWTPMLLNAEKTIPFDRDLLKGLYLKDGKLKGSITNSTPYDLLDAVVLIGTNLIPVGDIIAGDTLDIDIPFDSNDVYKRPEEYLDGVFGRSYYNNPKDYPPNFQELMQRRSLFENYINELYNMQQGKTKISLLARNNQVIDYGIVVNDKEPQKYNRNLVRTETDFSFQPGQQVEIPGGIIWANMYQNNEVGWQEGLNGVRINNTGDIEFRFSMPGNLNITELGFSIESYIPLYVKYNMMNNNNYQTEILSNQYEYFLYNVNTKGWDKIEAKTTIDQNPSRYIGSGNEVRMMVRVVAIGRPDGEEKDSGIYKDYQQELLSMPEVSVKGVAK